MEKEILTAETLRLLNELAAPYERELAFDADEDGLLSARDLRDLARFGG